jgi:hypothetical protein
LIGRHATADRQPLRAGALERLPRLRDQHIDDGFLETGRQIRALRVGQGEAALGLAVSVNFVKHGGFEAAEAKIEAVVVQEGAGKGMSPRISSPRRAFHGRPAGEAELQNRRHLVERFARRIVDGRA